MAWQMGMVMFELHGKRKQVASLSWLENIAIACKHTWTTKLSETRNFVIL